MSGAAAYLAAHGVEAAIARAFAEIVVSRPEDPVSELGRILLRERQQSPAFVAYVGIATSFGPSTDDARDA